MVHMATASDALTDECMLFASKRGGLQAWAQGCPDPRKDAAIGMAGICAASWAARCAGLYALRKRGDVVQSAEVVGELGSRGEGIEAGRGRARRGPGDAPGIRGEGLRQRLVQREHPVPLRPDARVGEGGETRRGRVRERGSRRTVKGPGEARDAQGRGQGVGEQSTGGYTPGVGASWLA
jgi:hypothetical protein